MKNYDNYTKVTFDSIEEFKDSLRMGGMDEDEVDDIIRRIGKDIPDVTINKDGSVTEYFL